MFPSSGPTAGNTRVVIAGTDLGAAAQEMSVLFGDSVCEVIADEYIPGWYHVHNYIM